MRRPALLLLLALALTPAAGYPVGNRAPRAADAASPPETLAITFLTARLGWRLTVPWNETTGLGRPVTVRRTTDGGSTWRALGTISGGIVFHGGNPDLRIGSILFATPRDGWAYGETLFATHDGGRTWTQARTTGTSTELSLAGRSVWRVDMRCVTLPCAWTLFTGTVGSDRWSPSAFHLPHTWNTGASLARANPTRAWLLSGELLRPNNRISSRLLATADGGKTWRSLPAPCLTGSVGTILVAHGPRHLWAFCGLEPSAGQQLKEVDRSDDGGRHWRVVSASDLHGLHNLTSSGYLHDATLTSPSSAWLALGRGTLLHSPDGGRTWKPAIPYATANPGDGGVGPVQFVDARHGWLFSFPYLLFRTADGGRTWAEL